MKFRKFTILFPSGTGGCEIQLPEELKVVIGYIGF